ncbi:hypothetical protein GA0111570_104358 [Raineyella antarctica]|uniref:Uncharacterized protein n=1 Tax=Raineyella antarctica TaxID=1577474 RepID=A0A1G6GS12_9ACTN|nr:hypothetical protein GA0111570_104358 [Raineyella antarctica]
MGDLHLCSSPGSHQKVDRHGCHPGDRDGHRRCGNRDPHRTSAHLGRPVPTGGPRQSWNPGNRQKVDRHGRPPVGRAGRRRCGAHERRQGCASPDQGRPNAVPGCHHDRATGGLRRWVDLRYYGNYADRQKHGCHGWGHGTRHGHATGALRRCGDRDPPQRVVHRGRVHRNGLPGCRRDRARDGLRRCGDRDPPQRVVHRGRVRPIGLPGCRRGHARDDSLRLADRGLRLRCADPGPGLRVVSCSNGHRPGRLDRRDPRHRGDLRGLLGDPAHLGRDRRDARCCRRPWRVLSIRKNPCKRS